MKKAAKILFLIAGIVAILGAVGYLVSGIVFFALSGDASRQIVIDMINSNQIDTSGMSGTVEEVATIIQATFLATGVVFLIFAIFSVVAIIFAFKARNTDKKALFIVNIVLGALSGTAVGIVAGIFGLIAGDTLD